MPTTPFSVRRESPARLAQAVDHVLDHFRIEAHPERGTRDQGYVRHQLEQFLHRFAGFVTLARLPVDCGESHMCGVEARHIDFERKVQGATIVAFAVGIEGKREPVPSGEWISYGPSFVPEINVMGWQLKSRNYNPLEGVAPCARPRLPTILECSLTTSKRNHENDNFSHYACSTRNRISRRHRAGPR